MTSLPVFTASNMAHGSSEKELKIKIDRAGTAADEFHKIYYETYDKKRHMLSRLYLSNAKLVWNGNAVEGIADILKFIENLPSTETSVDIFDCHPLSDTFSQGQTTIAVVIFGSVKYHKQKPRAFHQHFILTSQDNFCRIVSDDYRFLD